MIRISQRDILPTAIRTKELGDIIHTTASYEDSQTLTAGQDVLFTFKLTNDKKAIMIGEPEISLWHTSVTDANLIPNGTGVDMDDFQVVGPFNEWTSSADNGTADIVIPSYKIVSRVYVRNTHASSSFTIYAKARIRYLTNLDKVTTS